MPTHKVLIPLDGSEFSRAILRSVRTFLDPDECELILLQAFPEQELAVLEEPQPFREAAESRLAHERERDLQLANHPAYLRRSWERGVADLEAALRADARSLREAGYTVSVLVRFGDPAQEIVDAVEDERVDLVAMATHGQTGFSHSALGGVADQVLRSISVPLLLARPLGWPATTYSTGEALRCRLAHGEPLRVAVATSSRHLAQIVDALTGSLGRALNATVILLVVIQEHEEPSLTPAMLKSARNLLREVLPGFEPITMAGWNYEAVLEHLATTPCDLLVTTACEATAAGRPFAIGLTAQRLVQLAPASVLMVKGDVTSFERVLACTIGGDELVGDIAALVARAVGARLDRLHVPLAAEDASLKSPPVAGVARAEAGAGGTTESSVRAGSPELETTEMNREALNVAQAEIAEAILAAVRAGNFDLLVVGSRTDPQLFPGSIAERVVCYAPCSVLVVRLA